MPELTIRVPLLPPNSNKSSRIWYVNHKGGQEFAYDVRRCAVDARNRWETERFGWGHQSGEWQTLQKAMITVSFEIPRSRRGSLPDYGNLLMGMKKAVDQLTARPGGVGEYAQVGIGLIADDSPKCLTWAMPLAGEQVIRGEEACTVIKVEGQVD